MADLGIKQGKILKSQLPSANDSNEYLVRYRIISEDRNRVSHWSQIFEIGATPIVETSGELVRSENILTVAWVGSSNRHSYDVFIKFDGGSYVYHETTPIHTYSFIKNGSVDVRVLIQASNLSKTVIPALKIFESNIFSLV